MIFGLLNGSIIQPMHINETKENPTYVEIVISFPFMRFSSLE